MVEIQSAQIIPMGARVVAERSGSVKMRRDSVAAGPDLLRPSFEIGASEGPWLWLRRLIWRRRLRGAFRHEPDAVLEDFGLSRDRLERYLAQPFWRAPVCGSQGNNRRGVPHPISERR